MRHMLWSFHMHIHTRAHTCARAPFFPSSLSLSLLQVTSSRTFFLFFEHEDDGRRVLQSIREQWTALQEGPKPAAHPVVIEAETAGVFLGGWVLICVCV